jgi:hypothetical protein
MIELQDRKDWEALSEAVQTDCAFLRSHSIMDYSLLVGVCPASELPSGSDGLKSSGSLVLQRWIAGDNDKVYRIAIIDILQPYSPKKWVAHFFKSITIKLAHEIDTEPPGYYASRFTTYTLSKLNLQYNAENNRAEILNNTSENPSAVDQAPDS